MDPLGLKPGDPYAAGIAAGCYINDLSIAVNWEYAGNIYQLPNGTYTYTTPATIYSSDTSSPFKSMPPGNIVPTAQYHTHGAYDPSYGAGNFRFSPDDKNFADSVGKPNYMTDPNGDVKRYDPDPKKNRGGSVRNMGNCSQCN